MSLARNSVPEVSDEVVLITSDSLTLTASRALLIKHSPFFAELLSLPSPEPNAIPLDLPSATSAGLGLILGILACVRPDESTGSTSISPMAYKYWMAIKEADLYIFGEAALCADAYDFPIFERLFVRHIIARLDHDPMLKFTFCAITGQTGNLKSLASETMTGTNRPEIPHTMSEVLQRFAPDVRGRLTELYRRYPSARHALQLELRSTQHVPNEDEDFSRRCGTGRTCSAYDEYDGKWRNMRRAAADNVYQEVFGGTGGRSGAHSIRLIVARTVTCPICTTRLTRAFYLAVDRFLVVCDSL